MNPREVVDHVDHARDLHSAIIGTVKLVRVLSKARPQLGERDPLADSEWFFGEFGWVVEEPFALPEPVPCRGSQGLWTMPPDVEAKVLAQEATRINLNEPQGMGPAATDE